MQPHWVVRNVHGDKFNETDKFKMSFVNVLLSSNQNNQRSPAAKGNIIIEWSPSSKTSIAREREDTTLH